MIKIEYVGGKPRFPQLPVKVSILRADGPMWHGYATDGASGFDISSASDDEIVIPSGEWRLVKTGFKIEIPYGFELQIRSRSGLALKHGIQVLNGVGTVDADYRGEVGVILINHGKKDFSIFKNDRIAQGVICPVVQGAFKFVTEHELLTSNRGTGGFGSTGV